MNTSLKTIIATCLMAIAIPASAQNAAANLNKAFDNTVEAISDHITSTETNNYADGYFKSYVFTFDNMQDKNIKAFQTALIKASTEAYSSIMKKAGSNDENTTRVSYGDGNSLTIEFGAHKNHNYNVDLLRDPTDSTKRYVFALVSYEKDKQLCGSIYKIYGSDPRLTKRKSARALTIINTDGAISIDGKEVFNPSSLSGAVPVPQSSADFIQLYTNLSTLFTTCASDFQTFKENYASNTDVVTRRVTLLTGTANRIMRLCTEYGKKRLKSEDRDIVSKDLLRLSKLCTGDLASLSNLITYANNALQ